MPHKKPSAVHFRQVAEDLFDEIPDLSPDERADYVTSLVRQWTTYDGNATMFIEGEQVLLRLGRSPLGRIYVDPVPVPGNWTRLLVEDWQIDPDDLDEVLRQMNRGQGAEVFNRDGVPLRLWVDPRKGTVGIEPLVERQAGQAKDGLREGRSRRAGPQTGRSLRRR